MPDAKYNLYEENSNHILLERDLPNIRWAMRLLGVLSKRPSNYSWRIVYTYDGYDYHFMSKGDIG